VDKAIALFVSKIKKKMWAAPSTFLLTPYHILRKQTNEGLISVS
jgi:hypothetical protein